jgi:hypothetical protein
LVISNFCSYATLLDPKTKNDASFFSDQLRKALRRLHPKDIDSWQQQVPLFPVSGSTKIYAYTIGISSSAQ